MELIDATAMGRLTQADLADLNSAFEQRTPQELIRWAREVFGPRVAALSSMQKAGNVICHMLSRLDIGMPGLFVLKTVLLLFTAFVALQALAIMARCVLVIAGREEFLLAATETVTAD